MSAPTAPGPGRSRPGWKLGARFAAVILVAFVIGWMLNGFASRLNRSGRPAGFGRGLIQGALMPASMPNLLIGYDVEIYSEKNQGVRYKLGYTMGVNACGAIFFGMFYWRLKKWRDQR